MKAGDDLPGDAFIRRASILMAAVTVAVCALAGEGSEVLAGGGDKQRETRPKIVFVSNRDGSDDIYAMNCDGTGIVRLTDGASVKKYPAWSPGGNRIAFMAELRYYWELYLMNADGSEIARLSRRDLDTIHEMYPVWSPDGRTIAYSRDFATLDLYLVGADGLKEKRLVYGRSDKHDPAWSPDGKSLLFSWDLDGDFEICLMNLRRNRIWRLTNRPGEDRRPAWSPDGRKIAFQSKRDGYWAIYLMNSNGSLPEHLTHGPGNDFEPAWTPDGRIVYCSDRDGNEEIYIMNADGTGQTNLTNNPARDGSLSSQAVN